MYLPLRAGIKDMRIENQLDSIKYSILYHVIVSNIRDNIIQGGNILTRV